MTNSADSRLVYTYHIDINKYTTNFKKTAIIESNYSHYKNI